MEHIRLQRIAQKGLSIIADRAQTQLLAKQPGLDTHKVLDALMQQPTYQHAAQATAGQATKEQATKEQATQGQPIQGQPTQATQELASREQAQATWEIEDGNNQGTALYLLQFDDLLIPSRQGSRQL